MISREVRKFCDNFARAQVLTTTPGMNGWTVKDASTSGSPTYLCVSGQGLVATLASTGESEVVTIYFGDVLPYDLTELQRADFIAKVSGVDANTTIVIGVASAQQDTPDSVSTHAWFRIEGSASTSAIVCETDDGATDTDDKATGATLSSTLKKLSIDFQNGLSDVRFYIDGEPIAQPKNTFSLAAAVRGTTFVQPFIQIQKASGTGVPSITIRDVEIQYRQANGA